LMFCATKIAASNVNGKGHINCSSFKTSDRAHLTDNKRESFTDTDIYEIIDKICLDTFITQHGISNIDVIKIDTERHEKEVLHGLGRCIQIMRPAIIIEVLSDDLGDQIGSLVKGLNYLYYNIDENGGIRKTNEITKSDYFNYLLCNEKQARQLNLV